MVVLLDIDSNFLFIWLFLFFVSTTVNVSSYCLLAFIVSNEKTIPNLLGGFLLFYFLSVFKFFFVFAFQQFLNIVAGCDFFHLLYLEFTDLLGCID